MTRRDFLRALVVAVGSGIAMPARRVAGASSTPGRVASARPEGGAPAARQTEGTHTTATLSQPRDQPAAVVAGRTVLFVGGTTDGNPSANVDLFDAMTASWSTASLSEARTGSTTLVVGDVLVITGGLNRLRNSRVVDRWDTRTGAWTSTTRPDTAGSLRQTVALGQRALFISDTEVQILDTASGNWSRQPLSEPRFDAAVAVVGETLLVAGGYSRRAVSATVDIYDGSTETWSQATLSAPRMRAAVAVVGSTAIFAGGSSGGGQDAKAIPVADLYDAATGAWSSVPLPWGSEAARFSTYDRSPYRATTVGNVAVIFSGPGNIDTYDGETGAWNRLTTQPDWSMRETFRAGDQLVVILMFESVQGILRFDAATRAWFLRRYVDDSAGFEPAETFDWRAAGRTSSAHIPWYSAAEIVGSSLVFAGGWDVGQRMSQIPRDHVRIMDLDSGVWTAKLQLSRPSTSPVSAVAGTKMVVATETTLEVIDPVGGTVVTELLDPPRKAAPELTVNGQYVLAAGGQLPYDENHIQYTPPFPGVTDAAHILDTVTGVWSRATLSQARREAKVVTVGTRTLVIGGQDRPRGPSDAVDLYDTATGDWWTETFPDPLTIDQLQSSPVGASGVALLTDTTSSDRFYQGNAPAEVVLFDAATRSWRAIPLSTPRFGARLVTVGSKVLVVGGYSSVSHEPLDVVDGYDFPTGAAWTGRLSGPRRNPLAAVLGSRVVVVDRAGAPLADLYDADLGTWTPASLPMPFSIKPLSGGLFVGESVAVVGQRMLFANGGGTTKDLEDIRRAVNIYDAEQNSWIAAELPDGLRRMPLVVGAKVLYLVADYQKEPDSQIHVYDDTTRGWSTITSPAPFAYDPKLSVVGGRWVVFSDGSIGGRTIYDAQTGEWTVGSLPAAMTAAFPATAETYGQRPLRLSNVGTVDLIDPETYARRTVVMTPARDHVTAVTAGRKIIVAGGSVRTRPSEDPPSDAVTDIDIYTLPA